jgi:hypothetical protein
MTKTTTHYNGVTECEATIEHPADIPESLAELTMQILRMHKKNGDLAWVDDMLLELEAE